MVASEDHAEEGIDGPFYVFGLSATCCNIINNPVKKVRETNSRIQSMLSFLSLAILSLLLIDCVESSSQGCRHSKHHKQKNMPSAAAFIGRNETEMAPGQDPGGQNYDWNLCLTTGCVSSANSVIRNMDRKLDPCDNFFEFACGKFLEEARIPDDKTGLTSFSVIDNKLREQLRDILNQPVSPNDIKPFVYAKNLFNVCMNTTMIEEKGATPFLSMLKEIGGWPVLEGSNWNEAEWDWKKSVYTFRKKGFNTDYFLGFDVRTDLKNSSARVIVLDQATVGLGRDYLVNVSSQNYIRGNKMVADYYDYMVDIAVLFGADRSTAKTELEKSLNFEINLSLLFLSREERRDVNKIYNPMTLSQLQKNFPSIPWTEYLQNLLPDNIKLEPNEKIVVFAPYYILKLEVLMRKTPKRVQANYALWRVVSASVTYLPDNFRRRQLVYATAMSGKMEREARWIECIKVASGGLAHAVGSLYVRKFFKEDSKKNAVELVCRVRKEMYKIIEHVDWMDEETRSAALEKAKAMTTHIAYPDELLDDEKLTEFYANLEIGSNDYFGAILNLTRTSRDYTFSRLRDPVNKTEWTSHGRPAIVNAFYNAAENSIQFPAGILQGILFNKDRPHYMNYGAIGVVIGHEITHGFDDKGRQFDKDGNLVEWWDEDTKKKYLKKVKCIINQYGNYTVRSVNMKVNGINTQGENIADNGGVKEAYYAYQSWVKQFGNEPRLPGLQTFTPQQMFWISGANVWCSKYRDLAIRNAITSGVHSPGEFRVIGPFSNLKEFSQDFGCPSGSKMNPQHKCSVW